MLIGIAGGAALLVATTLGAAEPERCAHRSAAALETPVAVLSGWQGFDPQGAPAALSGAVPLRPASPSRHGELCAWRGATRSGHVVELTLAEGLGAAPGVTPVFLLRILGGDGRVLLLAERDPRTQVTGGWTFANPCARNGRAADRCAAPRFRPGFTVMAPSAASAAPGPCADPIAARLPKPVVKASRWLAEDAAGNEMRLDGTYELAPAPLASTVVAISPAEICRWEALAPTGHRLALSLHRPSPGRAALELSVLGPDGTPIAGWVQYAEERLEGFWPIQTVRRPGAPGAFLGSLFLAGSPERLGDVPPELVKQADDDPVHLARSYPRRPGALSDRDAESRRRLVPVVLSVLREVGRRPPGEASSSPAGSRLSRWQWALREFALMREDTKGSVRLLAPAVEHSDREIWRDALQTARDLATDAAPILPSVIRAARRLMADTTVHEADRAFAVETIGIVGRGREKEAIPTLLAALRTDGVGGAAANALAALGVGTPEVLSALSVDRPSFEAAAAFVELGGSSRAALERLRVRAVEELHSDGATEDMIQARLGARKRAIAALMKLGDAEWVARLLVDPVLELRDFVAEALAAKGGPAAAAALARYVPARRDFPFEQRLQRSVPPPPPVLGSNVVLSRALPAIWSLRWEGATCELHSYPPPLFGGPAFDGPPREARWEVALAGRQQQLPLPAALLDQRGEAVELQVPNVPEFLFAPFSAPAKGWSPRRAFRCGGLLVVEPDGRIVAQLRAPPGWDPAQPLRWVALDGRIYAGFTPRPDSKGDRKGTAIAVEIDPVTLRFVDARRVDAARLFAAGTDPVPPPGPVGFGGPSGRVRAFGVGDRFFVDAD